MSDGPPGKIDEATLHTLNNHLTVILGFVDFVIADTPVDHPRYADLIEIRSAAEQAAALLGQPPPSSSTP